MSVPSRPSLAFPLRPALEVWCADERKKGASNPERVTDSERSIPICQGAILTSCVALSLVVQKVSVVSAAYVLSQTDPP